MVAAGVSPHKAEAWFKNPATALGDAVEADHRGGQQVPNTEAPFSRRETPTCRDLALTDGLSAIGILLRPRRPAPYPNP